MPTNRRSNLPKSYGRQADGKTIKSLSLDADLVQWSESRAGKEGLSFSAWMNSILRREKSGKPAAAAKPAAKPTAKQPAKPKAKKAAKPAKATKKAGKKK